MNLRVLLFAFACLAGCAPATPPVTGGYETFELPSSQGGLVHLGQELARNELTVLVFFSKDCPCVVAHEPRLERIAADYAPRGVRLLLVDSEVGANVRDDAAEARRRGYSFPLLTDRGGALARHVQAEFATHAVVLDRSGRLRYSGGLDSDQGRLHEDARHYLRDALDSLLAGREPSPDSPEALGCVLQLR